MPAPTDPALVEAKKRYQQGVASMGEGRVAEALVEFEASHKAFPSPGVLYNIGLAQKALSRPVDALHSFRRYLAETGPAQRERRQEVERLVGELSANLQEVRLSLKPEVAVIVVNGKEVGPGLKSLSLEPGVHALLVTAPGYREHRGEVSVVRGEDRVVEIQLLRDIPPLRAPEAYGE